MSITPADLFQAVADRTIEGRRVGAKRELRVRGEVGGTLSDGEEEVVTVDVEVPRDEGDPTELCVSPNWDCPHEIRLSIVGLDHDDADEVRKAVIAAFKREREGG